MSVLYLKTVLNYGLGAINGEDASKAGGHGSQRARFPVSLCSIQLARFPVSLHIGGQLACLLVSLRTGLRSHSSRSVKVKQMPARHLLQPLKPRHVASRDWLTKHTRFKLYKTFEMLQWQLVVSKCLCWLLFECAFSQNGHEKYHIMSGAIP